MSTADSLAIAVTSMGCTLRPASRAISVALADVALFEGRPHDWPLLDESGPF